MQSTGHHTIQEASDIDSCIYENDMLYTILNRTLCIHTKINIPQTCRGWYKSCKHLNIYTLVCIPIWYSLDVALLYTYCLSSVCLWTLRIV